MYLWRDDYREILSTLRNCGLDFLSFCLLRIQPMPCSNRRLTYTATHRCLRSVISLQTTPRPPFLFTRSHAKSYHALSGMKALPIHLVGTRYFSLRLPINLFLCIYGNHDCETQGNTFNGAFDRFGEKRLNSDLFFGIWLLCTFASARYKHLTTR